MKPIKTLFLLAIPSLLLAYPGEVIRSFPSPSPAPTGLTFDGKHLWMADHRTDRLTAIDPETGETVREIPSPGFWPMGLAWDGENLWNADQKQNKIFRVDPADGAILTVLDSPAGRTEGLTWDGKTLWLSDSRNRKIIRIDLSDGTATHSFASPGQFPQGLAWDGTWLWCADRLLDETHMIDPESGEVFLIAESPGPYPRGLAWDGLTLWNVDYQTDSLYQMVRRDGDSYRLKNSRTARVTFTHEFRGRGRGIIREMNAYLAIPENLPQQTIRSIRFEPEGWREVRDRWDQRFAHFHYEALNPETRTASTMIVETEISEIIYYIFPDRVGSLKDIPREIREKYTADDSKYRTDSEYIRDLAAGIVGSETHPYRMARRIFDHVRLTLEYQLEGGWNSAPVVLERGTGSCSEYTFAFIALCRAAGLPARYAGSIVVRGDDASLDDVFHRWPEVYLPGYGWVPMDPQGGDKESSRDRAMNIGRLPNRFLITTRGGGDSEYLGWYYNAWETFTTDPQVEVEIEAFGEWEPITAPGEEALLDPGGKCE
ncbi:MAG TPA: transglutaminase [bacterium]|nr:transglutaminase [bacterium]